MLPWPPCSPLLPVTLEDIGPAPPPPLSSFSSRSIQFDVGGTVAENFSRGRMNEWDKNRRN